MQLFTSIIIPHQADQRGGSAKCCNIERHVAGASGTGLGATDPYHRYGRFRRNTRGATLPVAIKHDVTDHEYSCRIKLGNIEIHPVLQGQELKWPL